MIILFFVTIYLFSVVPAFSSWQTERKAEICSEEKKFEAIFSETKEEKFETIFSETEQEKRKKFEMMFWETKEKKFKTVFSETTPYFRNKPGKGHWRVCKGCIRTDLKKVPWESCMLLCGQSFKGKSGILSDGKPLRENKH